MTIPVGATQAVTGGVGCPGFADFGGRHCETASMRKLLGHHGVPLTEEMLFGLGGGISFMYLPGPPGGRGFVGGRNGPFPVFTRRMAAGVGLELTVRESAGAEQGYARLHAELASGHPVICYGDLFHLPYLRASRHFGGHAFVVFAIDEAADKVSISDRNHLAQVVTLAELARARGSDHPPFPPRHALLCADFATAAAPDPAQVLLAIRATAAQSDVCERLDRFGADLTARLRAGPPAAAVTALVDSFIDLELAGTGGNAFRSMYAGFLAEASALTGVPAVADAVSMAGRAVAAWRELIGLLLPDWLPGLAAVRQSLVARDRALLAGDPDGHARAAAFAEALPRQRHAAEPELARSGRELSGALGAVLRRVGKAERGLFQALRQV